MRAVHHELVAVAAEDLHVQTAGLALLLKIVAVFGPETDDADLRLAVGHQLQRRARVAFADDRVEALLLQPRQIRRCRVEQGRCARNAHTQPVRHGVARAERVDLLELAQNTLCMLQKHRAALGRTGALAAALKDAEAHGFFHLMQNAAEVGLADEQVLRRL